MRNHEFAKSRTDDEKADEGVFLPAIKKIVSFFSGSENKFGAPSTSPKPCEQKTRGHDFASSSELFFSSDLSSAASFKTEIN